LVLYQPQNGYCYNSDTHFLFNFICRNLEKYKNISGEFLDIGSGSGILGLLLAKKFPKLILNQVEIQEEFQHFSQINANTNSVVTKMHKGSFLDIKFSYCFDFCVSNPPFYHQDVIKSENKNLKIARYNDNLPLKDLIKKSNSVLKSSGKLFFCYDSKQLKDIVLCLNEFKFNLEALQFVHPNAKKEASLVMVYAKKSSKSLLKIFEPLVVFDDNKDFTKDVLQIYKDAGTHSIKAMIE
jgi:tRNA1Val (adenine37-N6)-methyltransferase